MHKIVRVEWVDSMGGGGDWKSRAEIDDICRTGPCKIVSVGLVYHEPTQENPWLTIGMDYCQNFGNSRIEPTICKATMTVPQCAILSMQELSPVANKTKRTAMPKGYEKMRDKFISEGMSEEEAKKKAARIWNSKHKSNPVTRKHK